MTITAARLSATRIFAGLPQNSTTMADSLGSVLAKSQSMQRFGKVAEAYGTLVKVTGLQVRIGELCLLRDPESGWERNAEVVGLTRDHALLAPMGGIEGLSSTTQVVARGRSQHVRVGPGVLGRVLNAHGEPIDGQGPLENCDFAAVDAEPPNPLMRPVIDRPLGCGVRAIDTLLTCGEGQRVGIFAVAGGGKSTLLGMLARGSNADVNVVALVGERGREVREFLVDNLGEQGLRKSVVVVATSDRPAMERARAAVVATAIAEYFRDQGNRVQLLVDSVTRYARALRDLGLSVGEPPTRRGYPPSVFSALPRLFERAGTNQNGSITAFYSVLTEEEDSADPIAEEVRSILDGHIVLSRKLGAANHFPAIDILSSASRVMSRVASRKHLSAAATLRGHLAKYHEIELLLQLGEYKAGGDSAADEAVRKIDAIKQFLRQPSDQFVTFEEALAGLQGLE